MQNQEHIKQKVCNAIEEALSLSEPIQSENLSFKDDLDADSVDMVSMLMILEDDLGIEIKDEDSENFKTIQDVINYVAANDN